MAWRIEFDPRAVRELSRLDKPVARRIVTYLQEVGELSDPRSRGQALTGNLAGLWRYRVGDYRIIVDIHDTEVIIVAVQVGHRSSIYG